MAIEKITKCTIRLPHELVRLAKVRAAEREVNFQDVVADALRAHLVKPSIAHGVKGGK